MSGLPCWMEMSAGSHRLKSGPSEIPRPLSSAKRLRNGPHALGTAYGNGADSSGQPVPSQAHGHGHRAPDMMAPDLLPAHELRPKTVPWSLRRAVRRDRPTGTLEKSSRILLGRASRRLGVPQHLVNRHLRSSSASLSRWPLNVDCWLTMHMRLEKLIRFMIFWRFRISRSDMKANKGCAP